MNQIDELRSEVQELRKQLRDGTASFGTGRSTQAMEQAKSDAQLAALGEHPEYHTWRAAYDVAQKARINNGSKSALERLWKALEKEREARVEWNRVQKRMGLYS